MPEARTHRGAAVSLLRNCALLLSLFAPSVWMIATIPPLWRDVDAYNQVTHNPLVATFWGHAPAYCYLSRVPLLLGEQFERSRGIAPAGLQSASSHLTDSGVWLLIVAQHVALCGAAFYFICAVSALFWVRLALALAWAGNALFYTFAHCVGSETLSMVLVILLVVRALRLVQSRSEPRWTDWYVFAMGLCLCLLSRHVNLWLILLLPAAFLLSWAQTRISSSFVSGDKPRRGLLRPGVSDLRQAMIAIAIGVACFAVANSVTHGLARKTRFHPHSRIGFTFLWRLHFLKTLTPDSRAALLRKVTARTQSAETRKLIVLLGSMQEEEAPFNAGLFLQRAVQLLYPGRGIVPWEKLDGTLNQMAYAFLLPPTAEHWHVAKTEFAAALKMPVTVISSYLFDTTAYYFQHKDEMPGCAELVTFRNTSADQLQRIPAQHLYFRLGRDLSYNKALLIWFLSLLVFVAVARRKRMNVETSLALGIAVTTIGLLMMASTCLLGSLNPRYALPMWQLLFLSLFLFVGKTAALLHRREPPL
jgi:hypothetical protein